jgi:uncharacterized membrane protein YqjE
MIDDPVRSAGGTLGEYAYTNRVDGSQDRPMSDVIKDIIANVQSMVRSEIRLAKAELKEETGRTMAAAKLLGIGAGLGFFAIAFVLTGLALLLALVMPAWAATLLVGVALGIGAAVMLSKGREQLSVPTARKTIDNVKENVEWMKNQTK